MSAESVVRTVEKKVLSLEQSEGQGAKVRRSIGRKGIHRLDPFLLLDEFKVQPPAGFPDHPHRGFETVTYVTEGAVRHKDSKGNSGTIYKGDLQWMTAGRGVVHSEMPAADGPTIGLQLWVNLQKSQKMVEPAYQDLKASKIPTASRNGTEVKVIAGESMGVSSPVRTITPVNYLIFKMDAGAEFTQPIPAHWNAFIYIMSGSLTVGEEGKSVESGPHYTLVLSQGGLVRMVNPSSDETTNFVLIAGQPIGEPVAQHGPFVMNTEEELEQAFEDYHLKQNGFETGIPS